MRTTGSDANSAVSTQNSERNERGNRDKRTPPGSEAVQKFRALLQGRETSEKVPAEGFSGQSRDFAGDQDGTWRIADLAYQHGQGADPTTLVHRTVTSAAPQVAWAELFDR